MAIRIQTEKPVIPIELGELKFEFDVTDESIKKFRESAAKITNELENINVDENDDDSIDTIKDVLKRGYDLVLGDGAFDKVYNMSPSVVIVMSYFARITEGIGKELKEMGFNPSPQDKAKKYLANKKK